MPFQSPSPKGFSACRALLACPYDAAVSGLGQAMRCNLWICRAGIGCCVDYALGPAFGCLLDVGNRRTAVFVAKMLDRMCGRRPCKAEMLFPPGLRTCEAGIEISTVKNVTGAAGIDDQRRWYVERGHVPDLAVALKPVEPTLAEGDAADPATLCP